MLSHILPKAEISIRENLNWLYILRNLMLFVVVLAVFFAVHGLGIVLPMNQLWLAIFAISILNLYTWLRLRTPEPVTEHEIFSQICMDVLALAYLLYLTGGASNPIIWVFLLPLIVTAIMLPQSYAWNMVIITSCVYTVLIAYNVPLPALAPHADHSNMTNLTPEMSLRMQLLEDRRYFNLHVFGMWFGFVFSSGLVAFFIVALAKTLKERERSLAEARESALRDERVISLGTLAASAAHDMGTPLGTIAILAHDLAEDFPDHRFPELNQKLTILQQQVERCKQALSVMSASAGELRAESGKVMRVADYVDEVLNQWRTHKAATKLNLSISGSVDLEALIIAERTLTHSLINILNNAAEATDDTGIDFHANWDANTLSLKIRDHGPGLPAELIDFAGHKPVKSNKQGMGVGLFLTYTTIMRLRGTISFNNLESGGACVEISLPLLTKESENDRNFYG
ncbi:MAG: ATP-binding protein [Gammaproteobacteria bacterium]